MERSAKELTMFAVAAFGVWCGVWSAARKPLAHDRMATWQRWAADCHQLGHPEVAPAPASAYRFLLTWIATYLLFFTLAATKLPNYVLPIVVPCAVLTARFLERWRRGQLHSESDART